MNPRVSDLQAVFAAVGAEGHTLDLIEMRAIPIHLTLFSDRTACLLLPREVVGRRASIIINALTALANASPTAQIITIRKPCTNDLSIADFNDEAVARSIPSGSFTPANLAR